MTELCVETSTIQSTCNMCFCLCLSVFIVLPNGAFKCWICKFCLPLIWWLWLFASIVKCISLLKYQVVVVHMPCKFLTFLLIARQFTLLLLVYFNIIVYVAVFSCGRKSLTWLLTVYRYMMHWMSLVGGIVAQVM